MFSAGGTVCTADSNAASETAPAPVYDTFEDYLRQAIKEYYDRGWKNRRANFIALVVGHGHLPPPWVTYSPLPPLAVLLLTGLYLFVLPYTVGRTRPVIRGREASA